MPLITFDGIGENLVDGLREGRDALVQLREETTKENEALKKLGNEGAQSSQRLAGTIEATAKALQKVRQEATGSPVAASAKAATDATEDLNDEILQTAEGLAAATFAADALTKEQSAIRAEALKVAKAVKEGKITQEQGLEIARKLSKEYAANALEMAAIKEAALTVNAELDKTDGPTKSLRTQLREAREELDAMVEASDGNLTPELIAAAKRAGELQDRFGDLNATIEAFNPDTKFKAVLGVLGNVAGGAQAASAAFGLLGTESDELNEALVKVQQTTAFFQGFQALVGGLADNWKNLRTVIAASTLATNADTAAKAANTAGTAAMGTANTAAAGATGVLTGALIGLKAALLSNPITAIAVAVLAVGAAFLKATSDTRDYNAELDETIDGLERLTSIRTEQIQAKLRLENIAAERRALEAGETDAAKRRRTEEEYLAKRAALVAQQFEFEANMLNLINELESLRGKNTDSAIEARQRAIQKLEEYTRAFEQTGQEIKELEEQNKNDIIRSTNETVTARREAARRRIEIQQRMADEILRIEQDLAKKVEQANLQGADPGRRLELQREAGLAEVREIQNTLQQKIALAEVERRTNAATYEQLTEAQKEARAQALIDSGEISLTVQQQEQIAALEIAVWEQYWKDRVELDTESRRTLLELQADGIEKERAAFDLELDERVKKLEQAGATSIEIEKFVQAQRDQFRVGQVQKAIDLEEQTALAKLDAQQRGAESEFAFQQRIELERLSIQETAAKQRLDAIKEDTSDEANLIRAQLEGVLSDIDRKREELAGQRPDFNLFKLLGVEVTEEQKAQLLESLRVIGSAVFDAVQQNIALQQQQVQSQIDATDQIIEDQQRRRDELQAQLEQELADKEAGYANDSDAIRAQIEQTTVAEQQAQEEKRRLIQEQKRLAKQQVLIDASTQASAIAASIANLVKSWSTIPFGIGLVSAFAQAALIVSTFSSIKSRIKSATADVPQFYKGTTYVDKEGAYPRTRDSVPAMLDYGEAVVPRKHNKRWKGLVEGIVEGDFARVQHEALKELLGTNIRLEPEEVVKVVRLKEREQTFIRDTSTDNTDALRKEVRALR
ncbi:MAG TPA: hypothetical protein PKJ19_05015 [Flavobacteriales bacterium]|nr:hypothetical protein [Flavobacteriales bacterium]